MSNSVYPGNIRGLTWTVYRDFTFNTSVVKGPNLTEVRVPNTQMPIWHWELLYEYLKNAPDDIQSSFSPYTDVQYLLGFLLARQGMYDDFLFSDPEFNSAGPNTWQVPQIAPLTNYYPTNYVIIDPAGHQQTITRGGLSQGTLPSFNDSGGTTIDGTAIWQDGGAFPGANAQSLQLVNDGSGHYYTPLQRYIGGQFYEDITDLNTTQQPLRIWANGVLQTGGGVNYTLSSTPGLTIPGYSFMGLYLTWQSAPTAPITGAFNYYFRVRFQMDSQDFEQFTKFLYTIGGQKTKNGTGMLKIQSSRAPQV